MSVLALTAHTLGTMEPRYPALARFNDLCEGRHQPCWQGIEVGITTVAETQRILDTLGYRLLQRTSYGNITYDRLPGSLDCVIQVSYNDSTGSVQSLAFEDCKGLRLGDVESWLGAPDRLVPNWDVYHLLYNEGEEITLIRDSLSPYSNVPEFEILSAGGTPYDFTIAWKGYQPDVWYCHDQFNQYGVSGC